MERRRLAFPLPYRRARSLFSVIGLFWLWLLLGSAALIDGFDHAPLQAAVVVYALAVIILVSIPAALLAGIQMILTHPGHTDVVKLPAAPRHLPLEATHWKFGEKVS